MKTLPPRRKSTTIANSRWTAYATAGAASALACVPTVEGDIHYSGLINQSFNDTDPGPPFVQAYFQLDQPGNSINPAHLLGPNGALAAFAVYGNAAAIAGFSANGGFGTYPYASKLSFGQALSARPFLANGNAMYPGARGTLAYGNGYPNEQWKDPGIGFVAFRFDNGGGPQYGWARLDMDGVPGNSFRLIDFAWGDVGDRVTAGQTQVPEPGGTLGLLALGAVGVLAVRKRQVAAA